ncbi:hypothetical protein DNK47_02320 [Mycoplasma wenyonii]|uniref:Uncharacterized protein n=1 Tax=Mycoplasma wenyonii TaxID=65123 RepID=A0A328PPB3_9MOLU|nr:hypothetical protein [Mycoplasma wenyonii]RAO94956.1 hypothetical protein DNK47_02320 [Mycoplasma wenyonii]
MPFITKALHLIVVGSGATFAAQGVNKAQKWFKETFSAPPALSSQEPSQASNSSNQESSSVTTVTPSVQQPPQLAQILKKEGYEGCELLKGQRIRKQVVYVCWKKDGSTTPSLYHYDRSKYQTNKEQSANQITGITYQNSNLALLKFKDGKTENLSSPHVWMRKWQSKGEVKPETECKFEKVTESSNSHKLTCADYQVQTGIHFSS